MPSSSLFLRSSTTFFYCLSLLSIPIHAATLTTASTTTSASAPPVTSTTSSTAASATPSAIYTLETSYSGNNFFNNFDFFTDADPTHGFVQYLDQADAETQGLISVSNDGSVIIGVDSTNIYNASTSVGRPSVRITSQEIYNHGLFLADIANMPGGVCGTWPALWTLGNGTWPYHGEIDILEGANDNTNDLSSMHTAGQCSIAGTGETGYVQTLNCTYDVNTGANSVGCGIGTSTRSFKTCVGTAWG
jgi:beta-glucanase (GH16 family)